MDEKNRITKIVAVKIVLIFLTLVATFIANIFIFLAGLDYGINIYVQMFVMTVIPMTAIPLILAKKKKIVLIIAVFYIFAAITAVLINFAVINYKENSLGTGDVIDTSVNINTYEYLPFDENSKIARLDKPASLKLEDDLPKVDGAAAVFPLYSAFVNETYPDTVRLHDRVFEYNNTVYGYERLADLDTDIFFGAYPSEEQIDYAEEQGTEFEFTEIGKDAFVFFVNVDNPIDSLTSDQIRKIYSGEIKNWKEVGGNDEKIIAFQRNEGSGSQSMLERFMGDTPIKSAPTERINDLMSGIIETVADYRNNSNSIGFSFRYYLEELIANPNVKMLAVDGVSPTPENIRNGSYPITTPLYAVTYKDNKNENVAKLIDWIKSDEGQELVEKTGYIGILSE